MPSLGLESSKRRNKMKKSRSFFSFRRGKKTKNHKAIEVPSPRAAHNERVDIESVSSPSNSDTSLNSSHDSYGEYVSHKECIVGVESLTRPAPACRGTTRHDRSSVTSCSERSSEEGCTQCEQISLPSKPANEDVTSEKNLRHEVIVDNDNQSFKSCLTESEIQLPDNQTQEASKTSPQQQLHTDEATENELQVDAKRAGEASKGLPQVEIIKTPAIAPKMPSSRQAGPTKVPQKVAKWHDSCSKDWENSGKEKEASEETLLKKDIEEACGDTKEAIPQDICQGSNEKQFEAEGLERKLRARLVPENWRPEDVCLIPKKNEKTDDSSNYKNPVEAQGMRKKELVSNDEGVDEILLSGESSQGLSETDKNVPAEGPLGKSFKDVVNLGSVKDAEGENNAIARVSQPFPPTAEPMPQVLGREIATIKEEPTSVDHGSSLKALQQMMENISRLQDNNAKAQALRSLSCLTEILATDLGVASEANEKDHGPQLQASAESRLVSPSYRTDIDEDITLRSDRRGNVARTLSTHSIAESVGSSSIASWSPSIIARGRSGSSASYLPSHSMKQNRYSSTRSVQQGWLNQYPMPQSNPHFTHSSARGSRAPGRDSSTRSLPSHSINRNHYSGTRSVQGLVTQDVNWSPPQSSNPQSSPRPVHLSPRGVGASHRISSTRSLPSHSIQQNSVGSSALRMNQDVHWNPLQYPNWQSSPRSVHSSPRGARVSRRVAFASSLPLDSNNRKCFSSTRSVQGLVNHDVNWNPSQYPMPPFGPQLAHMAPRGPGASCRASSTRSLPSGSMVHRRFSGANSVQRSMDLDVLWNPAQFQVPQNSPQVAQPSSDPRTITRSQGSSGGPVQPNHTNSQGSTGTTSPQKDPLDPRFSQRMFPVSSSFLKGTKHAKNSNSRKRVSWYRGDVTLDVQPPHHLAIFLEVAKDSLWWPEETIKARKINDHKELKHNQAVQAFNRECRHLHKHLARRIGKSKTKGKEFNLSLKEAYNLLSPGILQGLTMGFRGLELDGVAKRRDRTEGIVGSVLDYYLENNGNETKKANAKSRRRSRQNKNKLALVATESSEVDRSWAFLMALGDQTVSSCSESAGFI